MVLSSGGARGLAHIGAIEELLSRGYNITSVAGASAGSLVGGIYAAGGLEPFKKWLFGLDPMKVMILMDVSVGKNHFLKGEKELTDFYTKEAGITVTPDFERQLKDMVFKQADDGMLALMATRDQGFLIISLSIPAIKAPGNPFYNEDYAKKHASDLLLCSDAIEYSAVCTLLENNYLPDAALNSHKGYEYGRKMLQDNAQFIIDYMFAEHK